jgi:hypothetical protein
MIMINNSSILVAQRRAPFFVELLQILPREPLEVVVSILSLAHERIEFFHELFVVFLADERQEGRRCPIGVVVMGPGCVDPA